MGAWPVVLCRRFPRDWDDVNQLVEDGRPPNLGLAWLERDASSARAREALPTAAALMGAWLEGWPFLPGDFAGSRLRVVQLMSAGYETVDLSGPRDAGIPVANIGTDNATTVAEHALALMLASLRRLPAQTSLVAAGGWRPAPPARELRDRTVGIVGLGNVGTEIARRVRAFGAAVLYTSEHRRAPDVEEALGVAWRPLPQLIADSDILCLAVSLTARTRHLVGARQLAVMKPGALLVNVSRGAIVDEAALVDALTDGRLWGAALDVLATEPPPADHPLRRLPNVILTPHQAGLSPDAWPRIVRHCWANVAGALAGRSVANRVA